ncbi:MAG: LCP family protein [Acidimicrobiales bacterium]
MPNEQDEGSNFRARLTNIPSIDDAPLDEEWARQHRPPVLRVPEPAATPRRAPIARPASLVEPDQEPYGYDDLPPDDDNGAAVYEHRRRRWPWLLGGLAVVAALVVAIPLFIAWRTFDSIERIDLGQTLTPIAATPGTNILLVGTDSREGIDTDTENSGLILGDGSISGQRSDTIMILRLNDDGTSQFLSLPRDLWLPINGGGSQRINTAIGTADGAAAVVNTVQDELGVPINNYVQIDLAGFIDLVDALGGVTITIPHPAFDRASGLDLPTAGDVTLDSTQALAYVRSRRYTEIRDGREVTDPTSDLGRVQRQQDFMRALFAKSAAERNPIALNDMASAVSEAVIIDETMALGDVIDIARKVQGGLPESTVLPTRPASINGNSVLLLADDAGAVLATFGANPG